ELIGAEDFLGFLAHDIVAGGKQLGGDGGVENVFEEGGLLFEHAAVCEIIRDKSHHCLGQSAVDAVHRHVVARIGGKAEAQLGEIARADKYASVLVGKVEAYLCALSGLGVFKHHAEIVL